MDQKNTPIQGIVPTLEKRVAMTTPPSTACATRLPCWRRSYTLETLNNTVAVRSVGAEAVSTLGLSYPIVNPTHAWQVIQNRAIASLVALREEMRSLQSQ